MALSIELFHDTEAPLTPGSIVAGALKFTGHEDQIFTSPTIDFRGHTSVFLNQYYGGMAAGWTAYSTKSYLFSRHLCLRAEDGVRQRGTYVWLFTFRIPLFAAPRTVSQGSDDFFEPQTPFQSDLLLRPHPLPPSMHHTGRFVCDIRYVLEAALVYRSSASGPQQRKARKSEASRSISVQSLNMSLPVHSMADWLYITHRRTVNFPAVDHAPRHIFHLLRKLSPQHHTPEPEVKLSISVMLPKQLEIKGRPALSIPISCVLECPIPDQGAGGSGERECPPLVVHSFKVSLVRHVHVRVGGHHDSWAQRIWVRKGTCMVPVSPGKPTGAGAVAMGTAPESGFDFGDVFDLVFPAQLLSSDFSTYNIARAHTLDIDCCIKYRERSHKLRLRRVPLHVVPQSGGELESRLQQGLEPDDEYGCRLLGIPWQDYGTGRIGCPSYGRDTPSCTDDGSIIGDDLTPNTPPPGYSA